MNIYIDLETTGLHPKNNGIISISYIVTSKSNKILSENTIYMNPNKEISPEALSYNRFTEEQIAGFQSSEDAYKQLMSELSTEQGYTLIGFNSDAFDVPFIKQWFIDNKRPKQFAKLFGYKQIDIFKAVLWLQNSNLISIGKSQSLKACTEYFKIPHKAHDGMSDTKATYYLDLRLRGVYNESN